MKANREEQLRVAEQAAEWLRIMEDAGAKECAAFTAWLQASPLHVRELLLMSAWDQALDGVDPQRQIDVDRLMASTAGNVVALHASRSFGADAKPARSPRGRWFAAAAGIAVIALMTLWVLQRAPATRTYSTAIGEQRTFELGDGSVVYLNTQSRVEVDFSSTARELELIEGEALFKVYPDARRPFRVRTGEAVVQAVGTEFNVHRREKGTLILVVEGKVRINEGPVLSAGQEITVARQGGVMTQVSSADRSIAWRQRRLVFRKDTLDEIATEFNRYNATPQLRIEGESLRHRRFNGVFDADDPEMLVKYLATDRSIDFAREGDELVIRER